MVAPACWDGSGRGAQGGGVTANWIRRLGTWELGYKPGRTRPCSMYVLYGTVRYCTVPVRHPRVETGRFHLCVGGLACGVGGPHVDSPSERLERQAGRQREKGTRADETGRRGREMGQYRSLVLPCCCQNPPPPSFPSPPARAVLQQRVANDGVSSSSRVPVILHVIFNLFSFPSANRRAPVSHSSTVPQTPVGPPDLCTKYVPLASRTTPAPGKPYRAAAHLAPTSSACLFQHSMRRQPTGRRRTRLSRLFWRRRPAAVGGKMVPRITRHLHTPSLPFPPSGRRVTTDHAHTRGHAHTHTPLLPSLSRLPSPVKIGRPPLDYLPPPFPPPPPLCANTRSTGSCHPGPPGYWRLGRGD